MAPRRGVGNVKAYNSIDYKKLSVDDVLCPICRSILIEPVTLPCNHGFCASCFQGTMENTNLVCPLCRVRIGSWLRSAKRNKTLVNEAFWKAINDLFPEQIQNKLNGVEEEYHEDLPLMRLATPGEIRKEYQIQKQSEDELFRKQCDQNQKASEELIRKIQEEEEFQRTCLEEKLKFDEQVAKKLADELNRPSTSKVCTNKKVASVVDKHMNNVANNLATKEYTCRILCMDKDKPKKLFFNNKIDTDASTIIAKKIVLPVQKVIDTEVNSDSNDSIEAECRHFKPIDYRRNPPSEGKPPVRVPSRRAFANTTATIISPAGTINFNSNILESAFARMSYALQESLLNYEILKNCKINKSKDMGTSSNINTASKSKQKRKQDEEISTPSKRKPVVASETNLETSPIFRYASKTKRQLFASATNTSSLFVNNNINSSSVGFHSAIKSLKKSACKKRVDDEESKRLQQEKNDLEFARKLQEEYNKTSYSTRSRIGRTRGTKRQVTLDEMCTNSYKVK